MEHTRAIIGLLSGTTPQFEDRDKCDTQLSGTNLNFITAQIMYIYCKD